MTNYPSGSAYDSISMADGFVMSNRSARISAKSPPDGFINTRADTPGGEDGRGRVFQSARFAFVFAGERKKKKIHPISVAANPAGRGAIHRSQTPCAVPSGQLAPLVRAERLGTMGGSRSTPERTHAGTARTRQLHWGERWELNPRPPPL